jgi:hypothetical protein
MLMSAGKRGNPGISPWQYFDQSFELFSIKLRANSRTTTKGRVERFRATRPVPSQSPYPTHPLLR